MSALTKPAAPVENTTTASRRLRATMAAVKLSFSWFGVRRALTSQQKTQAADSFGAEGKFLTAAKKLLDTSAPAFREVTRIRTQAMSYWKSMSVPFPEPGIRLIRQDAINEFDNKMQDMRDQLQLAVDELDRQYEALRRAAQQRLGDLYEPGDYPATLVGLFSIDHCFPSVEVPNYLQQLNPELYEQQCQRVQAQFDEAVRLAEQAFVEELHKLVDHLTDRLAGQDDGKPKVFRDSAVDNLHDFFERFRRLNVRSNDQLENLVDQAQQIVRGVNPQQLRNNGPLRQQIASRLAGVQSSLDGLLVDRPRRKIQRGPRKGNHHGNSH